VVLADGDWVVRQHTMHARTHGGRSYTNVYCFVFRFDQAGRVLYLTEHGNTWHAERFLLDQWSLEPAHPLGTPKAGRTSPRYPANASAKDPLRPDSSTSPCVTTTQSKSQSRMRRIDSAAARR